MTIVVDLDIKPQINQPTCKFVSSMLRETESPGVTNIETDDQRYSMTGSESRVRSINGRAMLLNSTV